MSSVSAPRYREVSLGGASAEVFFEQGGIVRMRSNLALAPLPQRLLDRLVRWAAERPDATFVAKRDASGAWQRITYTDMLVRTRAIAQALLAYGLSAERPLAILSGNDLDHLQIAFGAMYAGIPYCPVSPAYALLATDFAKLRHIFGVLTPGLVFAADGAPFARAIEAVVPADVPLVLSRGEVAGRASVTLDSLLATPGGAQAEAAFAATGPDTIAKFLFTSGSTKLPKAVVTTQRMLCANQQMLLQSFPVLGEEPPVLVDWLPWNHTFGGSHNIGIALYNGGSFHIDDGRPTAQHFGETLRNLREIAPTVYLSVPKGWEDLVAALETDADLRDSFFARMKMFFFAAAALSQDIWDRLDRVAELHCGERIRMLAGLGMTECSPSCTFTTGLVNIAGDIGLPAPGCEVKLVPVDGKLEGRFLGPHVMPGYWRSDEQTREAFDEEGYYRSGDAVKLLDPERPERGLMFDGRIAEDFKLSSGVFVSVGPLRTRVILEAAPYVQDVVVIAPNREDIGIMIFPRVDLLRTLAALPESATPAEVVAAPAVRDWLRNLLDRLNLSATGSATRVARACLLAEPPALDRGEVTDKGSINQRAVLSCRADKVDALYRGTDPDLVLPSA
jgi:feruloyl-CoA synthase